MISELTAWVMAAPERSWFLAGMMVGMFLMFSILTGYWLILDWFLRRIHRGR